MTEQHLYQKIFYDFVKKIEGGEWAVGDQVPTEKQISAEYGVSRITSKRAMEELRDAGYIERRPGRGSFVIYRHGPLHPYSRNNTSVTKNQRHCIGLIIPDFSDSYGSGIVTGAERSAREHELNFMLSRSQFKIENENAAIDAFYEAGCSGIIIMPQHNDLFNDRILRLILGDYPVVVIDREMHGIDTNYIATDNFDSAYQATKLLIEQGHRDVIFISYPVKNASSLQERMSGFKHAFYDHKHLWDESLLLDNLTDSSRTLEFNDRSLQDLEIIKQFILNHTHATAIFATEYNFAQLAIQAVEELGMKVPEDFSVVGYDGPSSQTGNAYLSRVIQPEEEMGWLAVDILSKNLAGDHLPKRVKLQSSFFKGSTLGPARQ